MSDRVRWGILGNATIARKCIIPAIGKCGNGALAVLATRRPKSAVELKKTFGIGRLVADYEAVIADPGVDAVYIPLPNHLHLPWTLKALGAGKHVLCEKPLALNAAQAETMAQAAAAAGRLLMEGFMYRFHPRMQAIRSRIQDGEIGEVHTVRAAFCYRMADSIMAAAANFRLRPETGGGALLDVGCYGVSLARWLLDAEPDRVQAQAVTHDTGVDIHATGIMGFGSRTLATVEASFISALQQTATVTGSKGAVELPHDAFIPWEKPSHFTLRTAQQETGNTVTFDGADEYQLMVEAFADAVLGRKPLPFSPEESVRNLRVLDALGRAARTGAIETP